MGAREGCAIQARVSRQLDEMIENARRPALQLPDKVGSLSIYLPGLQFFLFLALTFRRARFAGT
jgi:hypothetical protein